MMKNAPSKTSQVIRGLNKKLLLVSTLAALGLSSAAVTFAGDHERSCGGKKHSRMHSGMGGGSFSLADRLQRKLDLSAAQVSQIDEITDAQHKAMRDLNRSARDQKKAMFALDPTQANYDQQVAELAIAAGERTEQMLRLRAETRAKIAAVLTAEQQEKMKALQLSMKEKWHSRHHHNES